MSPLLRDHEKLARMEQAVRVLINGLGEEVEREGLRDTPKRVAKALLDCTQGYHQDTASTLGTALFREPIVHRGDEGFVMVRDIDFASTNEHTLLPFHGCCHVAYRPTHGVVLGLSKLARLTKQYAKRLQTQERLAADIACALVSSLDCAGVAVVLQARHLRHAAPPAERVNAVVSGVFATPGSVHFEELLTLLRLDYLPPSDICNLECSWHGGCDRGNGPLGSLPGARCPLGHERGVPAPRTPEPSGSEKDTDGDSEDLPPDSAGLGCGEAPVQGGRGLGAADCSLQGPACVADSSGGSEADAGMASYPRNGICSRSTTGFSAGAAAPTMSRSDMCSTDACCDCSYGGVCGMAACISCPAMEIAADAVRAMENAVECLLAELGEQPGRPGLAGSARRYVASLLAATSGYPHRQGQAQQRQLQESTEGSINQELGASETALEQASAQGLSAELSAAVPVVTAVAGSSLGSGTEQRLAACATCGVAGGCKRTGSTPGHAAACDSHRLEPASVWGEGSAHPHEPTTCGYGRASSAGALCSAVGGWALTGLGTRSCPSTSAGGEALELAAADALDGAFTLRLPFTSQCEHHMLPFYGSIMIAYLPTRLSACGASGLQTAATTSPSQSSQATPPPLLARFALERVVRTFTARLQVQERITHQVADAVAQMLAEAEDEVKVESEAAMQGRPRLLRPSSPAAALNSDVRSLHVRGANVSAVCGTKLVGMDGAEAAGEERGGVMVVCDAAHMCMVARGVENHSGSTTTWAVRGLFANRPELRRAVLARFREQ